MKTFRITTLLRGAVAAAMMMLAAAACEGVESDQDIIDNPPITDEEEPTLDVRTDNIDFAEEDEPVRVLVYSNRDWTFESPQDWIHGQKRDDHALMISVDESSEPSTRTGIMVVRASESVEHTIEIRQLGWGKDILLSSTLLSAEADGDTVEVGVTTNFDIRVDIGCDWIKSNDGTRAHPQSTRKYTFAVEPNFNDSSRSGDITFSDAAGDESDFEPQQLTVRQKGLNDYSPGDAGSGEWEIKDPVKVKVTRAEADLKGIDGHGIEMSYDGNASTYYMTDNIPGVFPYSLTYYFDGEQIDYIRYTVASESSRNGNLKEVEIEVQDADGIWTEVMTHDFDYKSGTVEMPELLRGIKAVRLKINSAFNWKISVGEMEFLKQNPENFDWRDWFTDRSCSELLPTVTDEDIETCEHLLFRNLMRWIKAGTYDTEFRAAEYHAADNPNVQAAKEIAVPYSILDNPTGIVVKKDEELVVMAELNGRTDVRLAVYEFDRSAYEDNGIWNYNVFSLVSGVNRIKMPRPGMLYIMYNVEDWRTAPPVRIHFALGGTVNGYYDTQKHGPDRWNELLSKAKNYKIFDVMGRFSHMVYEVGHFRQYTKDVYVLAEIYDEIVYREQVFCGLMRNRGADELRHNRMLVNIAYPNSTTNAYMADGFISFISRMGQLSYAMNIDRLRGEGGFVLAHEIGHFHSNWFTRFAGTMTEVTNNTLQMYVTCEIYGGTSSIKGFDGYTTGWNQVIVPKASHHAVVSGYSYSALAPLWALELYFGYALGRTPKRLETFADDMAALERADQMSDEEYAEYFDGFYPTLFDRIRDYMRRSEENKKRTNAQYMMQFAVEACHAAKMDLTDYFTKWGFFTGEPGCEVDEADREAALKEIADAGYPPVTDAVEYITDDTWQLFKEKAKVVVGTATANKNGLTINGCSNVVAYELYDGDTLIRVLNPNRLAGNNKNNTFSDVQWQEGYRLCAVQYDGQRIEIEVE